MRSGRGFGFAVALSAAVLGSWGLATALAAERTGVERGLKSQLRDEGLRPGTVICRRDHGWTCRWRATRSSGGWTYHCRGDATFSLTAGWTVDPCHLHAPRLAPLLADPGLPPAFGYNEQWSHQTDKLGMSATGGADTNRSALPWRGVERTRGSYDWTAADNLYHDMLQNGVRPLFIIESAPCWAVARSARTRCNRDDLGGYAPAPTHYRDWGRFVAEAARRYPRVRGFEIWNEPNTARFWQPYGPSPGQYAKVLSVAYHKVNQVAPDTPVITGGVSPTPVDQNTTYGKNLSYPHFLTGVYKAFGSGPVPADGIGFHAYPPHDSGKDPALRVRELLAGVKDVMVGFKDQDRPIWVTETGESTTGSHPFTLNGQAAALVSVYQTLASVPGVPTVIIHRFFDGDYGDGDWSTGLGVVAIQPRVHEKPAYCALAAVRGSPCQ